MSWFKLVKRALRSPSKAHEKKSSRRREECEADQEEEKKREKKRWLLGSSSKGAGSDVEQCEVKIMTRSREETAKMEVQTRQGLAAASATVEAAAAEIGKLARPWRYLRVREHYAAVIIQTAFRGCLGRRAFHALRGIVKLQALVRGHNVRRQTKVVLKYMQALVRVQERVLHQQRRRSLSHEIETNDISWDSIFRDMSRRYRVDQDLSGALDSEKCFSYEASAGHDQDEVGDRAKCLDRWMPWSPWDNGNRRASADNHGPGPKRCHHHHQQQRLSPLPATPSPWAGLKADIKTSYSAANTPASGRRTISAMSLPNYMAATESAKAKARSPGLNEIRDHGSAKKKLSYPPPRNRKP